jgi:NAD-dependent deacetylase
LPHFEYFRLNRTPPLCQYGGFLKPATISFGQNLDPTELGRAGQSAMEADLVVALGSTLSAYPAAPEQRQQFQPRLLRCRYVRSN